MVTYCHASRTLRPSPSPLPASPCGSSPTQSIKLVNQSGLPWYETLAFLGLFMAVFMVGRGLWRRDLQALKPHRLRPQLLRSALDLGNNICVIVALRHLTLTLFYIFIFLAPIVVATLSPILLHERMTVKKAAAILAGFGWSRRRCPSLGWLARGGLDWLSRLHGLRGLLLDQHCLVARVDPDGEPREPHAFLGWGHGRGWLRFDARTRRTAHASNRRAAGRDGIAVRCREPLFLRGAQTHDRGQRLAVPLHAAGHRGLDGMARVEADPIAFHARPVQHSSSSPASILPYTPPTTSASGRTPRRFPISAPALSAG